MIELVIAAGVLMVATIAGYSAQVRSASLTDSSLGMTVAISDLEACMEELLIESASSIPNQFPAGEPIAVYDGLHLLNQQITPAYPGWIAGSPAPDPLEIVLTAQWTDKTGHVQRLRLVTAKAQ